MDVVAGCCRPGERGVQGQCCQIGPAHRDAHTDPALTRCVNVAAMLGRRRPVFKHANWGAAGFLDFDVYVFQLISMRRV